MSGSHCSPLGGAEPCRPVLALDGDSGDRCRGTGRTRRQGCSWDGHGYHESHSHCQGHSHCESHGETPARSRGRPVFPGASAQVLPYSWVYFIVFEASLTPFPCSPKTSYQDSFHLTDEREHSFLGEKNLCGWRQGDLPGREQTSTQNREVPSMEFPKQSPDGEARRSSSGTRPRGPRGGRGHLCPSCRGSRETGAGRAQTPGGIVRQCL